MTAPSHAPPTLAISRGSGLRRPPFHHCTVIPFVFRFTEPSIPCPERCCLLLWFLSLSPPRHFLMLCCGDGVVFHWRHCDIGEVHFCRRAVFNGVWRPFGFSLLWFRWRCQDSLLPTYCFPTVCCDGVFPHAGSNPDMNYSYPRNARGL